MKPEIKAQMIAALRSGKYRQGRGFLHSHGCYCYGGVLCDLAVQAGVATWEPVSSLNGIVPPTSTIFRCVPAEGQDSRTSSVPERIFIWAGCDEYLVHEGRKRDIYHLNDGEGLTFEQLADVLEQS